MLMGNLPEDTSVSEDGYILYSEDGQHACKMKRKNFIKGLGGSGNGAMYGLEEPAPDLGDEQSVYYRLSTKNQCYINPPIAGRNGTDVYSPYVRGDYGLYAFTLAPANVVGMLGGGFWFFGVDGSVYDMSQYDDRYLDKFPLDWTPYYSITGVVDDRGFENVDAEAIPYFGQGKTSHRGGSLSHSGCHGAEFSFIIIDRYLNERQNYKISFDILFESGCAFESASDNMSLINQYESAMGFGVIVGKALNNNALYIDGITGVEPSGIDIELSGGIIYHTLSTMTGVTQHVEIEFEANSNNCYYETDPDDNTKKQQRTYVVFNLTKLMGYGRPEEGEVATGSALGAQFHVNNFTVEQLNDDTSYNEVTKCYVKTDEGWVGTPYLPEVNDILYQDAIGSSEGTLIGRLIINKDKSYSLYAPSGGGGGGGSTVTFTPLQYTGNPVGTITIDGTAQTLYSKATAVSVTDLLSSGTTIATLTVDGDSYTIKAPSGGGGGVNITATRIWQNPKSGYQAQVSTITLDADPGNYDILMIDFRHDYGSASKSLKYYNFMSCAGFLGFGQVDCYGEPSNNCYVTILGGFQSGTLSYTPDYGGNAIIKQIIGIKFS